MDWSTARARAELATLLQAAHDEPQVILGRGRRLAVVISAEEYDAFDRWRRERDRGTLADALGQLRELCADEDYSLAAVDRRDRPNAFAAEDDR